MDENKPPAAWLVIKRRDVNGDESTAKSISQFDDVSPIAQL
jgi:hypothetical protein